jgi:hypothetical protein
MLVVGRDDGRFHCPSPDVGELTVMVGRAQHVDDFFLFLVFRLLGHVGEQRERSLEGVSRRSNLKFLDRKQVGNWIGNFLGWKQERTLAWCTGSPLKE